MSTTTYLAPYWGELKAITSIDQVLCFVSEHKEKYKTALFSIDLESRQASEVSLPAGGVALENNTTHIWIAGSDCCLYVYDIKKKSLSKLGQPFNAPATNLVLASNGRLLVTVDTELLILDSLSAKPLQVLGLPAMATALAVDPGGHWAAVGDQSGHISVYEAESQADFVLSDKQLFHTGAVNALVFEANELRFFSAGTDLEIFLIHARGKLDAEDKAKSNKHGDRVNCMLLGPGTTHSASRLYTGSHDRVIKSWPVDSTVQPGAFKDSVGKILDMCWCTVAERDYVAAITTKNTIQLFSVDESGKIIDKPVEYQDTYAWAKADCTQDPEQCAKSLTRLSDIDDSRSVLFIERQLDSNSDRELCRAAAGALAASAHPKSPLLLQKHLKHKDEKVREVVFDSLLKTNGNDDYQLLDKSLKSGHTNIATKAIGVLVENARNDKQALNYLLGALQLDPIEIRTAALEALEQVSSFTSGKQGEYLLASFLLAALASQHSDMRKLSLVRLYKSKLLDNPRVKSAIRLTLEDDSIPVRRAAFFVLLLRQAKLAQALRLRDEDFDRQLSDIEQLKTKVDLGKLEKSEIVPEFDDIIKQPLLQAMSCRQTDISMLAVHGLALLHDPRALALLLQFSRDSVVEIRVEVCIAFKALADNKSIDRLAECLDDSEEVVRGAAFTALETILKEDIDQLIKLGFSSQFEDVHQRTMQTLSKIFSLSKPEALGEQIKIFLEIAINDRFESIRNEAFKAILNKQLENDEIKTLTFLLKSAYVDIRQSVFTELMAEYKKPWAYEQTIQLLNDEDSGLRRQVMEFLISKAKKKDLSLYKSALKSKYADIRLDTVQRLIRQPIENMDELLVLVITDKNKKIRQTVLDAIISSDNRGILESALNNEYLDIRARAATALARLGQVSALTTLSEVLAMTEPKEKQAKAEWVAAVISALRGIAELEDSSVMEQVRPFVDHEKSDIRAAAVDAVISIVSTQDSSDIIETLMRHEDQSIRYQAALGLAYNGDAQALSILFIENSDKPYDIERFSAAIALGKQAVSHAIAHLESNQTNVQMTALWALLMLDVGSSHEPVNGLRILSARDSHIRAIAADALKHFSSRDEYQNHIATLINNNRWKNSAWQISAEVVKTLSLLLIQGLPKVKVRVVRLLTHLRCEDESEWQYHWQAFQARCKNYIEDSKQSGSSNESLRQSYQSLLPLIYGTYVGLTREQDDSNIRVNALLSLDSLLQKSPDLKSSVYPVYLQSLSDVDTSVRNQAFELLLKSDLAISQTCSEALSVMREDIGLRALQVLLERESPEKAKAIIEQVMLVNTDGLELKASELLVDIEGVDVIAFAALDAVSESMRRKAVSLLEAAYQDNPKARANLQAALQNRFLDVRLESAIALNRKHDEVAVNALFDLLSSAEMLSHQNRILSALSESGHSEVAGLLLDFLENDKRGLAKPNEIFKAIASYRNVNVADRLLELAYNKDWFKQIVTALVKISGHDQSIQDPDDLNKDKSWIEKQHPRHDDLLAKIFSLLFETNAFNQIESLIPAIRWSQSGQVDAILAKCCLVTDLGVSTLSITACSWRILHRGMTAEPLKRALQRPDTQVFAAIALAQAGLNDGLAVLLNTVQHSEEYDLRDSSVKALGFLGDERALEILLELARDKEHYLCDTACEAIGHLANSESAYEIFELLKSYVDEHMHLADSALIGLRWFNTEDAWKIIRKEAFTSNELYDMEALELLAFNSEPETQKVLLTAMKETDDEDIAKVAYESARQIFELNDLAPEYAVLENKILEIDSYYGIQKQLDIVCDKGSTQQILEIITKCNDQVQQELELTLLQRANVEISDLSAALLGQDPFVAAIAAHVIGNIESTISSEDLAIIDKALNEWLVKWQDCRQLAQYDEAQKIKLKQQFSPCVERLCWIAGKLGIASQTLLQIAGQAVNDQLARSIRVQAFKALQQLPAEQQIIDCAAKYLTDSDAEIRMLCVELLIRDKSKDNSQILNHVLSDQSSIALLANSADGLTANDLQEPVSNAHYQGLILPEIVKLNDIDLLVKIVLDKQLDEDIRLGGIEGLARLSNELAETSLADIASALQSEEELCKAAWAGKRRSFRARTKMEAK